MMKYLCTNGNHDVKNEWSIIINRCKSPYPKSSIINPCIYNLLDTLIIQRTVIQENRIILRGGENLCNLGDSSTNSHKVGWTSKRIFLFLRRATWFCAFFSSVSRKTFPDLWKHSARVNFLTVEREVSFFLQFYPSSNPFPQFLTNHCFPY